MEFNGRRLNLRQSSAELVVWLNVELRVNDALVKGKASDILTFLAEFVKVGDRR